MQDAGQEALEDAPDGGRLTVWVPEMVTRPWRVLDEPGRPDMEGVLARVRELDGYWGKVEPDRRFWCPDDAGKTLAELFPGSQFEVRQEFGDVRVVGLAALVSRCAAVCAAVSGRSARGRGVGGAESACEQRLPRHAGRADAQVGAALRAAGRARLPGRDAGGRVGSWCGHGHRGHGAGVCSGRRRPDLARRGRRPHEGMHAGGGPA